MCLNSSLQSWISALDVCYHTLCNPDSVAFKPIASLSSSNFPALWPAPSVISSHPDAVNPFLSISLLNLFSPQDAFWSFSVWFVLAASSGSRHSHLMAGCLQAQHCCLSSSGAWTPDANSQVLLTRTQVAEKLEDWLTTGGCRRIQCMCTCSENLIHLLTHLNGSIQDKWLIYSKGAIPQCRRCFFDKNFFVICTHMVILT